MNIQPDAFDLICVGSGLQECLIAGTVAKAGDTVLIIEPEDSYGSEFSSCTLDTLEQLLDPSRSASRSGDVAPDPTLVGDARLVHLPHFQLPVEGLQCWSRPGADLGNRGAYILDLSPKAMYQAEALVDVLVRSRAHNYVEFKLLEGSYIWRDGRLQLVPASKSDIFKDRLLSLADKRSLMKFISSAAEAMEGRGPLKDVLASDRPLASVVADEGLSPSLQDVVLYGIAMCDRRQAGVAATPATSAQPTPSSPGAPLPSTTSSSAPPPSVPVAAPAGGWRDCGAVTAAEGCATLKLLMDSLARFDGPGVFMCPAFGCGSIPEAFVRFAAVNGAVTVLRQSVASLLLAPPCSAAGTGAAGGESPAACVGVVTASGQVLRCSKLLANSSVLRPLLEQAGGGGGGTVPVVATVALSRAIVILDAPLAAGRNVLCLVLPPGVPGVGNAHPVRGLQMGPTVNVAPPRRYVLYLSTPAGSGTSAWDDLQPALAALLDTRGMQPWPGPEPAAGGSGPAAEAARCGSTPAASPAAEPASTAPPAAPATESAPAGQGVPRALRSFFYRQHVPAAPLVSASGLPTTTTAGVAADSAATCDAGSTSSSSGLGGGVPPNVACCATGDAAMLGYTHVLAGAAAVFAEHWPGRVWLGDADSAAEVAGGDGSDDDAVEELRAALGTLAEAAGLAPEEQAAGAVQVGVQAGGEEQTPSMHDSQ